MHSAQRIRHRTLSTAFVLSLLGFSTVSHADSCAPRFFTLSEAYEAADSIIVGLVTECWNEVSRDPRAREGSGCSFTTLEVLKDSVPRDYDGVASRSMCSLSMRVGGRYLLFLNGENQPLWFSESLGDESPRAQLANRYLQILRSFGNETIDDLTEPWMLLETSESCDILHRVGGNYIRFIRRKPDAPRQPKPDWQRGQIGGETVYTATVPLAGVEGDAYRGEAEIAAFGRAPKFSDETLMLTVNLEESSPAPARRVTLAVGDAHWPLDRMEVQVSFTGAPPHTMVSYYVYGDTAERILSAMANPSDIAVLATLIAAVGPVAQEIPHLEHESLVGSPPNDAYFTPTRLGADATTPSSSPAAGASGPSRGERQSPDPVLRVHTRSTQLPGVVERFHACYAGED